MTPIKTLPEYLVRRYNGWKATSYADNEAWYRNLAENGQHPRAMIISCCDSRVHVTSIFGADQGEFFIHRNIANLVPAHAPDGLQHGTSAALEYAVTALRVAHVIVLGHSACGGVRGCYDMCSGAAPELEERSSYVGRWMDILRPAFDDLPADATEEERHTLLEKRAVLASLKNITTFPFAQQAIEEGRLTLHGLWHDIGSGQLEHYDPASQSFAPVG